MNYFVRFNQDANQVFNILGFTESVQAKSRDLTLHLSVATPDDGDDVISKMSTYLVKDSVNKIEILNENEIVVFAAKSYSEASSLDISLNGSFNITDEDTKNDNEVDYALMFRITDEEE